MEQLTLKAIQSTFVPLDNKDEIDMLLKRAIEAISPESMTQELITHYGHELPVVWSGTYMAKYTTKGDEEVLSKEQDFNLALWVVTLTTLVRHQRINPKALVDVYVNWGKQEMVQVAITTENADLMAQHYISTLQQVGWLSAEMTETIEMIAGKPCAFFVYHMSELFTRTIEWCRKSVAKKTHMKCAPLRFKPQPWTDNFTGVGDNAKLQLIKGQRTKHVSPHVLRAVNNLQSVEYQVHPDIHALTLMVQNDPESYRELLGYNEAEWRSTFLQWSAMASLEVGIGYYFPVTADFRGRLYYRGGLVTPQGADFCKAGFVYKKSLPLQEFGFGALCISAANALGIKQSVLAKVKIVEDAIKTDSMNEYLADFVKFCKRFPKADHCQAWILMRECYHAHQWYLKHGTYATYMSCVPCHQDGSCNGLQHIAIMTKDQTTAKAVNLTKSSWKQLPNDAYGLSVEGVTHPFVVEHGRDVAKKPVMVGGYGAGEETLTKHINKFCAKFNVKDDAIAQLVINGINAALPALPKFTAVIRSLAEAVVAKSDELKQQGEELIATYQPIADNYKWMNEQTELTREEREHWRSAREAVQDGKDLVTESQQIGWTTPDGFVVAQSYSNKEHRVVRAGTYSAVMSGDDTLDKDKMGTALSPNFVHSLDSTHLRMVADTCNWDLTTIHDSYASHACNYYRTNKRIRVCLVDLYEVADPLAELFNSFGYQAPAIKGSFDHKEIEHAVNCFG